MSVADDVILWERAFSASDGQSYIDNFIPNPAWWSSPSNSARAQHVVYGAAQSNVDEIVCKSRERGSPSLYIHDVGAANYYRLSALFEQTVQAANPSCPDPYTTYCGALAMDVCTYEYLDCQQGMWCPAGSSCMQLGYQYWDCVGR